MPVDMSKYPDNWKTEIRPRVLRRAGGSDDDPRVGAKCEECGVVNHSVGARDRFGEWHNEDDIEHMNSTDGFYRFGHGSFPKMVRIVLTIAHMDDPDPMNCADENLKALCQRCHNRHDAPMRAKNRARNAAKKRGQLSMF